MSDTLSDVLRAVRLTGAVFFTIDAAAPWATETPHAREIASRIIPGAEHVIDYHIVTAGSCWAGVVGEPAVQLEAGDVIVFPQGDSHVMSSAPGMRGQPDVSLYQASGAPLAVTLSGDGRGRSPAELICGFLGCDARPFNPLLGTLPRIIHLRGRDDADGVIAQLINLALAETTARRAGGAAVLAHLSELLFVEVVRRHLEALPPEQVGWLSGLRDGQIGRALATLHERPAHPWSLEELAAQVGMSRSTLAERFAHFVGIPPMQYLAQWRMQLAATLLSGTALGLASLAEQIGYGSEAAFSRAFKRWVGVAPALWRQGKRVGQDSGPGTSRR
ncbi:MAG TPA: AraC family transcriptional regulator [Polyangia bacterium]|jgi:AraC-like DNA-binding protein